MKRESLIRRAILTVLLIEALCAFAFVSTALWHERSIRLRAVDFTLQGRSDSLMGAVQDAEDPADNVKIDPAEFDPPATDVYAVYNKTGKLVGTSRISPPTIITVGNDGFRSATADGHLYRIYQRDALRIIDREENGGVGLRRPVVVLYATRIDRIWADVLQAASFYVVMSFALLCVTALALVVLLRRLFGPLQELALEAAGIQVNSPAFRAPDSALRLRELAPLAQALSATIARLRLAFETQHRFMSDAAHELKTAVAVVRSTVQVLEMRDRTAQEYRRGLDQVLCDNDRVEELVSRMLTLARFEEPSTAACLKIDLSEEVGRAIEKLSSYAEARRVRLRPSLENSVPVFLASQAAEVLASNLVMNAIQHSPKGGQVLVSVRIAPSGNKPAVLTVQDFGTGIAPENLPRIFDRFFREDPSRSRETGGVGLGLAICKNIVEAAEGNIEVESVAGQGTTVRASFRLAP